MCKHSAREPAQIAMLPYVHGDRKNCYGRGAQEGHLDFHTAPELCDDVSK